MKNKLAICAALCAMAAMIGASSQVISSCRYGLQLCVELILPSLFPFFVVSILLSRLGFPLMLGRLLAPAAARLFRISGEGASAFLIGLTGGYPLGAAYIADMEKSGAVSKEEAERLLAFCNNSGPAFIIGAVGIGVFGSAKAGLMLYLIHICAAACTGLLFRRSGPAEIKRPCETPLVLPLSRALPEAVQQAVISVLSVCGFVVCFTVFTGLLDTNGFFSLLAGHLASATGMELHWCRSLLCGLLELGSGAGTMRGLSLSARNLALAASLLSWGGLSVHLQTLSVLSESKIKGALHFAGRLISACIAAVLGLAAGTIWF
ncbi:MAG: sporulation protein [Oscillospiraceae bacterium]|nr:sporulation protein [Oscillospiraceae bacterium]